MAYDPTVFNPLAPNGPKVPDQCCENVVSSAADIADCVVNPGTYTIGKYSNSALTYGCTEEATEWLEENETLLMWISIGIIAVMVSFNRHTLYFTYLGFL